MACWLRSLAVGTCQEALWGTPVVPVKRGAPPAYPQEEDREAEVCAAGGTADSSRELQPGVHADRPPSAGGGHVP